MCVSCACVCVSSHSLVVSFTQHKTLTPLPLHTGLRVLAQAVWRAVLEDVFAWLHQWLTSGGFERYGGAML